MKGVISFLFIVGIGVNVCFSQEECSNSVKNATCVTLDVVKHGFPNPDLYYFLWNFGDGEKGEGRIVDHCYLNPGQYKAILSLTNKETGAFFEDELQLDIQVQPAFSFFVDSPDTVLRGDNFPFNIGISEGTIDLVDTVSWAINDVEFIDGVTNVDDLASLGSNQLKAELVMISGARLCAEKNVLLISNTMFSHETRFLKDTEHFVDDSLAWSGNVVVKGSDTLKLSSIFFELDDMDLSAEAKSALTENVELINRLGNIQLKVGSFTYSEGDYYLNRKISMRRSNTIKEFLISKGVREEKILVADPENDESLKNTCVGLISCDFVDASLDLRTDIKITSLSN